MRIHLVCGYKRSGKDTFYKTISKGTIVIYNPGEKLENKPIFYIFAPSYIFPEDLQFPTETVKQVSLANMVKKEINDYFHIGFLQPGLEDICKDYLTFYDEEKGRHRTLREYYIEHAMKMRKTDPDHWCKEIEKFMIMDSDVSASPSANSKEFMITDWRFPNERIFFEKDFPSVTYRIFREEADNENFFDETEHSLDFEITDFLVVGKEEDIEKAKKRFPQYRDYILTHLVYL